MFRLVYLGLLGLLALGGWLSLGLVIVWSRPEPLLSRIFFFALLFLATFASGALAAYGLGNRLFPLKRQRGRLGLVLAQGLPLGLAVTFAGWLQSLRLLGWANGAILIALLGMLEFVLLPRDNR